jgi:hypothetical protein
MKTIYVKNGDILFLRGKESKSEVERVIDVPDDTKQYIGDYGTEIVMHIPKP